MKGNHYGKETRSVEELLSFIEEEERQGQSKKQGKRKKTRKKKESSGDSALAAANSAETNSLEKGAFFDFSCTVSMACIQIEMCGLHLLLPAQTLDYSSFLFFCICHQKFGMLRKVAMLVIDDVMLCLSQQKLCMQTLPSPRLQARLLREA